MPSGSRTQAEVIDNGDGTVTFTYHPTEEGLHQIHIRASGATVSGETATSVLVVQPRKCHWTVRLHVAKKSRYVCIFY